MKLSNLVLILLLIGTSKTLYSKNEISSGKSLRKLSLHLREKLPTIEESQKFHQLINESSVAEALEYFTDEFLNSKEFLYSFSHKIDELFRMSSSMADKFFSFDVPEEKLSWFDKNYYSIIYDLITNNESWDQLILSDKININYIKKNNTSRLLNFFNKEELLAYQYLYPEAMIHLFKTHPTTIIAQNYVYKDYQMIVTEGELISITSTENQKKQLAGIITTKRFLDRYSSNFINQNFSRAAAVYRVFMCDEMTPAIVEDREKQKKDAKLVTGENLLETNNNNKLISSKHASQKDCRKCHIKLDGVAKSYTGYTNTLGYFSINSNFNYTNDDGELIKNSTENIYDMAKTISESETYENCQINHFWKWFIGNDIPLTEEMLTELKNEFNKNDRRVKEFIKYIILNTTFFNSNENSVMSFDHVKPILTKKCMTCHNGNLTDFPEMSNLKNFLNGTHDENEFVIDLIVDSTNLHGKDDVSYMPLDGATPLTEEELNKLTQWIVDGAIKDGEMKISNSTAENYKMILNRSFKIKPTHSDTFKRIISKYKIESSFKNNLKCNLSSFSGLENAGFSNKTTGLKKHEIKSNIFKSIIDCLNKFDFNDPEFIAKISEKPFFEKNERLNKIIIMSLIKQEKSISWYNLKKKERSEHIDFIVNVALGENYFYSNIERENYYKRYIWEELIHSNNKQFQNINIFNVSMSVIMDIIQSQEFLTY